jgi:glucan 1,3-beta-glucosidase
LLDSSLRACLHFVNDFLYLLKRGGAFAEWDFLRGIKEGWIPKLPNPDVSSESLYGTCYDILNRTTDDYNLVVDEYPDPRTLDWRQWQ